MFKCTESQNEVFAKEESQMVQRREQPARRTDSIHSVYIAQGSALAHAQELVDEYEPTAKLKRRFSDPYSHIPCVEKWNSSALWTLLEVDHSFGFNPLKAVNSFMVF